MIASRPVPRPEVRAATVGQVSVLIAAFAYALLAELVRLQSAWPIHWVLSDLLPGLAFFVVGVVAWRRRPGNPIGPLLFAVGIAWFFGTWTAAGITVIVLAGYMFQGYYDGLLAWLVLAYPSGHLTSRAARFAVGAFLVTLGLRSIFRLVAFQGFKDYDFAIPSEADRYIADTLFRENGEMAFTAIVTGIAIVILALIVARLRATTGAGRRIAAPILIGGLAVAAGIVVEFAARFVQPVTIEDRQLLYDFGFYVTSATGALVPLAFLYGMARTRRARSAVADLVVELGDPERSPSLQEVLARALRDPSLEIAYAVPGTPRFVDAEGRPMELPDPSRTDRGVTRLEQRGEVMAALIHDPALAEEQTLVTSVAAAARMALDNERLQAEVRGQLEEVRASRARIVSAGDAERRRIERDLHDGAQQRLVTLALALQMASGRIGPEDPELRALVDRAGSELDSALAELRELARGVHPPLLAEAGLGPAIESLADRSAVPVTLAVDLTGRCRKEVEVTAYFVVSEALANIGKHARAAAAEVIAGNADGTLRVVIRDDGVGGADASRGSGLGGLADRVSAVGGSLVIESPADRGTTLTVVIPCA